jgi:cerevisin
VYPPLLTATTLLSVPQMASIVDSGVPVITAAGNDFINVNGVSPSRVPQVITVGATDIEDTFAVGTSNFGNKVNILAPGVDILSAGHASNSDKFFGTGTSDSA